MKRVLFVCTGNIFNSAISINNYMVIRVDNWVAWYQPRIPLIRQAPARFAR